MANDPTIIPYVLRSLSAWARLEPRQRTIDFDRSLSAEVRDPLWMLTRQWQWGEFKGEDTGSAIFARLDVETSRVTRFARREEAAVPEYQSDGGGTSFNFDNSDTSIPMEARVEQMSVPMDVQAGVKLGRRWYKLLKSGSYESYYADYLTLYEYDDPTGIVESEQEKANHALSQIKKAIDGRTIDGRKLYQSIVDGNPAITGTSVPTGGTPESDINALGDALVEWFDRLYLQPADAADSAWHPNHMEYQFACTVPNAGSAGTAPTALVAKEYSNGRLDWYSFDIASSGTTLDSSLTSGSTTEEADQVQRGEITMLPTGARFAGMPVPRYWEMEDGHIDIGDIDATEMDTGKVLFAEFALVFGNEWNVVPYDVPVGSLSEVKSVVVTDVFGLKFLVEAAGAGADSNWQRWNMYNLNTLDQADGNLADNRMFMPPVLHKVQESAPIEAVNFIRDETANMVWGVEATIPDGFGQGMNGYEVAENLEMQLTPDTPDAPLPALGDVFAQYILSNKVPENWIPFIPVRQGTWGDREIQLQRGVLPRIIPGLDADAAGFTPEDKLVRPRSFLLDKDLNPSPMYIFEEEVPRSGSIVKTTWQRTRWYNGSTYVWMGRRKTNGRGEGSSGLVFDQLNTPESVVEDE